MNKREIIFLGNGPLADAALKTLTEKFDVVFHARRREDLEAVADLKRERPELPAVLASFGVIIKPDLLELFEDTGGIINIHPSLLPKYRGPSPIEAAILNGDQEFGVSVMELAKQMDAGPLYYQATYVPTSPANNSPASPADTSDVGLLSTDALPSKADLYRKLAQLAAKWLNGNLFSLPTPVAQDAAAATYCEKLDRSMSPLDPERKSAERLLNEIRAFAAWPKSTYDFFGKTCIIHSAHIENIETTVPNESSLALKCADNNYLIIDTLQPAGKKPMPAKAFLNGYKK